MSVQIIEALERLGASAADQESVILGDLNLTVEAMDAIKSGRKDDLAKISGARETMMCVLVPAEDDEQDNSDDQPEQQEEIQYH